MRTRQLVATAPLAAAVHLAPYGLSMIAYSPNRFAAFRRALPGTFGIGKAAHVALTFDDGPHPEGTRTILEALEDNQVRATFFMIAANARAHPRVVNDVVRSGHEIALHGLSHKSTLLQPLPVLIRELREARNILADLSGQPVSFIRPPYGSASTASLTAARMLGMRTVLWTCWGKDWRDECTPQSVFEEMLRGRLDGGTVLLHDAPSPSSPGNWNAAAGAVRLLSEHAHQNALTVGELGAHGI